MRALAPVGAGGNVKVEVIDSTGASKRVERSSEDGREIVRVFIDAAAADVERGGTLGKSISRAYGVQRAGRR
jgi:hypothetical protein